MRHVVTTFLVVVLLSAPVFAGDAEGTTSPGEIAAGVGIVDITPSEPVVLAGSPSV